MASNANYPSVGKVHHSFDTQQGVEIFIVELTPSAAPAFYVNDDINTNEGDLGEYLKANNIIALTKSLHDGPGEKKVALVDPTNDNAFPPKPEGKGYGVDYDLQRYLASKKRTKEFEDECKESIKTGLQNIPKVFAHSKGFDIADLIIYASAPETLTTLLGDSATTVALYAKIFEEAAKAGITDIVIPAIAGGNKVLRNHAISVLFDGVKDFLYAQKRTSVKRVYLTYIYAGEDEDSKQKKALYTVNLATIAGTDTVALLKALNAAV